MKGLFLQEIKTLFKSPTSFSLLVVPVVLLIGLGFLLPAAWIIPSSITIGIVASVLLYFGGSIEEIKRTSFMKAISLTKLSKFAFLSTKILFAIILSAFIVLWVLFFGWIFTNVFHIMATTFEPILGPHASGISGLIEKIPFDVHWNEIKWPIIFYAGAITIAVTITLSFVFVTLSKTSLSFYLMSFGYLLAMILFGGVIMPSFLISKSNEGFKILYYFVPNYYTNNVMAAAFNQGPGVTANNVASFLRGVLNNGLVIPGLNKLKEGDPVFDLVNKIGGGTSIYSWLKAGGEMSTLNTWWHNIQSSTAWSTYNHDQKIYLQSIYNIFALPSTGGLGLKIHYSSWRELIDAAVGKGTFEKVIDYINHMGFFKKIAVETGATIMLSWMFTSPDFLTQMSKVLISGKKGVIDDFMIKHISGFWKYAEGPFWKIWGKHFSDVNTPFSLGSELVDKITSMFKVPFDLKTSSGLADLIVPWTETGLFLGVSIFSFKWS